MKNQTQSKSKNKSYPDSSSPGKILTDNLAIWIDGNCDCGYQTLDDMIEEKTSKIRAEINDLSDLVLHFHIKKVKGIPYWYLVKDGGNWKYYGKKDPRGEVIEKRKKVEESLKTLKSKMKSCVVKKSGKHLVIDIRKYKEYIKKTLPEDIIIIKDII